MHAAAEDLAELPGVEADVVGVDAVHRCLHDHRGRAVVGTGRAAISQAAHVLGEAGHVEAAMLHADVDVVRPGAGIVLALRIGQHMAAVRADIVDRLVLRPQFDRAVDT